MIESSKTSGNFPFCELFLLSPPVSTVGIVREVSRRSSTECRQQGKSKVPGEAKSSRPKKTKEKLPTVDTKLPTGDGVSC